VEQALVRAANLEALARVNLSLAQLGTTPTLPAAEDLAGLPDLGGAFNDLSVWRNFVALLEHDGLGL
jgi:hypothetical protein